MSADLDTLIRQYGERLDNRAPTIDELAVRARAPHKPLIRPRPRWTVAVAAAAVVLLVIGGGVAMGVLFGGGTGDMITPDESIPESWTTYTDANGLIGDCGCDIAVSSDGMVWIIGPDGASYFDGLVWSNIEPSNGFFRGGDLSVSASPDGALWFTGGGRAVRYEGDEWTVFEPEVAPDDFENDALANNPLLEVVVASDGTVWANQAEYTVKLHEGSFVRVDERFKPGPTDGSVEDWAGVLNATFAVAPDGMLWVSAGPGLGTQRLYRYDGSTVQIHPAPGTFQPELLAVAPDGSAWLAAEFDMTDSDGRLLRFDGTTWTTFPLGGVVDAAFDSDGTGWFIVDEVSTSDSWWRPQYSEPGAYRFDLEGWTHFTIDDGLAGHDLTAVEIGDDRSVWFGTYHHGVTRYQPGTNPESGKSISIDGEELSPENWPALFVTTTPPVPEE